MFLITRPQYSVITTNLPAEARRFRACGRFQPISVLLALLLLTAAGYPQSTGNAGSITGTVTDATGAVVPSATVLLQNPVSQYSRSATTDSAGKFAFSNVPLNPYHVTVTAKGFANSSVDAEIRSSVPVSLNVSLQIGVS